MNGHKSAIWAAIAAAALFGGSTPMVKLLVGALPPLLLAGLLYLGSGLGLLLIRLVRDRGWRHSGLGTGERPWLMSAIAFGGVLAPALLVFGLTQVSAGSASLLLNLEAVFTAVLAWVVFKENADRRIVLGMLLIVAGGVALAWPTSGTEAGNSIGLMAIAAACLCWGIDNNLTRRVSGADAMFIAGSKGLTAGAVNTGFALLLGTSMPTWPSLVGAMLVGLLGYGLSLVLFVGALRDLGTARTGAYFSTAPFIGAGIAILLLGEPAPAPFWVAALLMGAGVWLHITESHMHEHTHETLEHSHRHIHDLHHQHEHDFDWNGQEPHTHVHRHEVMTHKPPHFPDLHHRHSH